MIRKYIALTFLTLLLAVPSAYALDVSVGGAAQQSSLPKVLKDKVSALSTAVATNATSLSIIQKDLKDSDKRITDMDDKAGKAENCHNTSTVYDKSKKNCSPPLVNTAQLFSDLGCTAGQVLGFDGSGKAICASVSSSKCSCAAQTVTKTSYYYTGTFPPGSKTLTYNLPTTTACRGYTQSYSYTYVFFVLTTRKSTLNAICTETGWMVTDWAEETF